MHLVDARNVHCALPLGLKLLTETGEKRESRAGDVIVSPQPVTTLYERPLERVVFHGLRDANPFFHLFESLWMLAGRDDVDFVGHLVKRMATFSDDGKTLHGAYGKRWRSWFGFDQLEMICNRLRDNPDDRRNVLQMWDATRDLGRDGRDVPCNTQVFFWRRSEDGALEMTVLCRSNDVIWGAYGANAVHFGYLLEYMAARIGCGVGRYWQVSNNFHAYADVFGKNVPLMYDGDADPYASGTAKPFPLVNGDVREWDRDLTVFMERPDAVGFRDKFFRRVAVPLWDAHEAYKREEDGDMRFQNALDNLDQAADCDWRRACIEWIIRRRENHVKRIADARPG